MASGKSQHEAYEHAGFAGRDRSNAGKLARKPEVAARVEELQGRQAKRMDATVDGLVFELNQMLLLAKRVKHPAAGVGAILAKAKLLGLIVDKAEIEGSIRKPARRPTEDTKMSLEEWQKNFSPPEGPLQ
jgi:hypothetical protein